MNCASVFLVLHLVSIHSTDYDYNNRNPGVGLSCDRGGYSINVGTYYNSYKEMTAYTSVGMERGDIIKVGFQLGVATGYEHQFTATGGLTAGFDINKLRLRVIGVPRVRNDTAGVLHFFVSTPL